MHIHGLFMFTLNEQASSHSGRKNNSEKYTRRARSFSRYMRVLCRRKTGVFLIVRSSLFPTIFCLNQTGIGE